MAGLKNSIKIKEQPSYNIKEQWKYTNINNFRNIGIKQKSSFIIKGNNTKNITITNNELIQNNLTNTNISFKNIKSSIDNNIYNCKKFFNKIIPNNNNEFIIQNTENFNSGIHMHTKDNAKITEPIFIKNIIKTNDKKEFLNCRYLFTFGKNVSAKIIFDDTNSSKNYLNTVIEIFVDTNSKIDFIIDSEKPETTEIINLASNISNNSTLNSYHINLSGKLFKNNYFINLMEQNSTYNYNGINLLENDNHIDNYIEINHLNKHTISNTNQKNILKGKSKGVFYTKAIIYESGANSEAHQKNNNILLSQNAKIHSNPQLEIYNDDVKCSHGSTTGAIDIDSLFYLRSRGINLKEAKKILLSSFLNEIINPLDIIFYNNSINKKINKWLYNVN